MRILGNCTAILLLAGGINWGIVGLFDFDLLGTIFDGVSADRLLQILIGASALYRLTTLSQLQLE